MWHFKLNKKTTRIIKGFFVIFLVFSWLITGWPGIWLPAKNGEEVRFPPLLQQVRAASAGPRDCSSGSDVTGDSGGTTSWTTPNNACTTSANTTNALPITGIYAGHYLQTTGFGFTLPSNATVQGIQVTLSRTGTQSQGRYVLDNKVRIVKGGTIGTAKDLATTNDWATDTTPTYGTTSELWGESWLYSDINAANFGFAISPKSSGNKAETARVNAFVTITVTYSLPTTTLGADVANDPAAITVAPGSGIRSAGQFTLTTSSGSDTVPDLTLTLGGSPAGSYVAVDSVSIRATSCAGTLYFSAVAPSSDSVSFSGGTALNASTGGNTYLICITPKDHTLASGTYSVSPYISSTWTSGNGNTKAGTDSNTKALTIDNTAPSGATNPGGVAGDTKVTISWTTSGSGDFNTTSGSVVYRWLDSAGSEVPAEASTPSVGSTNGNATAACVVSSAGSTPLSKIDGTGGSSPECTTDALINGQAYAYKVFQKDNYGNYDAGISIGPFTPTVAQPTYSQNRYAWYYENTDLTNPTDYWPSGSLDLGENAAITTTPVANDPPDTTQKLRLRVNFSVATANLAITTKYFKLQYRTGTDSDCSAGSWTDVYTGNAWDYAASGITDGADITKSLSDTTTGGGEEYVKSRPSQLNHVAANIGDIVEYDFHIVGTTATTAERYLFRVVESDIAGTGTTAFASYAGACPILHTEPGTGNLMRHGNVFTGSLEQGFYWAD
jgi:hypothetical protein